MGRRSRCAHYPLRDGQRLPVRDRLVQLRHEQLYEEVRFIRAFKRIAEVLKILGALSHSFQTRVQAASMARQQVLQPSGDAALPRHLARIPSRLLPSLRLRICLHRCAGPGLQLIHHGPGPIPPTLLGVLPRQANSRRRGVLLEFVCCALRSPVWPTSNQPVDGVRLPDLRLD